MEPTATSTRRVFGPWVRGVKRVVRKAIRWYVRPQLDELDARLAQVAAAAHVENARLHDRLARLENERSEAQAAALDQFVEMCRQLEQLRARQQEGCRQAEALQADLQALRAELGAHADAHAQDRRRQAEALEAAVHSLRADLTVQGRRIGQFLLAAEQAAPGTAGDRLRLVVADDVRDEHDQLYAAFEERFRGSREEIQDRQRVYLPLLTEARLGTTDRPVLDLGCGRGEWLELLRDHGLHARGVDCNRVFVSQCRERGLEVVEAELFEHLRAVPDASVGAVTAFHVAEHLPFDRLLALFDEVLRVLQPGGLLVFETPNPENLIVGACNFYVDPTHQHPIPPQTLKFLAEARGFIRTDVRRLNQHVLTRPFADDDVPPAWKPLLAYIKHYFLAAPDYALIGWKP